MRIAQRSIEEVREAANIVEVTSEFTALRRQGARFAGLCPYPDHQEKTPSFSVTPDRGFYYCFGCLEANERIWTSRGLIPIGATEVGDEVIGLDGRRETITDKWFKSGPTLRIKTGAAKEGIEITPDHRCVFVRREEALRAIPRVHPRRSGGKELRFSGRHSKENGDVRLSIEHASEVRVGDFWLYPVIPDGERDDSSLPGEQLIKEYTKGPRNERIKKLHVNVRAAWLYGLWLAEGSLYRGGIKWSFGAHEEESLAEKVVRVLEEEFGRRGTKFVRPDKNNCEVTCSSTDLAVLFGHWFGHGCQNKRVPVQALSWTAECQSALIQGYLDGDGHANDGVTSAASVSEALAYGIFALCIQTGKVCSSSSIPAQTRKDGVRRRKTYYVHVLSKESLKGFFAEINGTKYFWSVVQEATTATEESTTTVVDITTTGSHTFLTKMGITHNCQRGGDAIKLIMDLKSFDFAEAVSYLAERSGVDLQFEGGGEDPGAAKERANRRRTIHKALAAAAVYYHKYLLRSQTPEAEQARRYLEDRRLELSTIEEFRLGYAPPRGSLGFLGVARKLGFDWGVLDAAGLVSSRGGERFAGRITFPISDRRGRIVGFGARALGDAQPKYLNSPETEIFNKRDLLYGFPQVSEAVRRERAALVVEGYTDVLMLYQSGIKNAIATLGTATTPGHLRMLSGYVDRIYVLFDPDAAGERAIERAAATAAELKLDLRVLRLPEDPADWLLGHPPEEFAGLLDGAVPILEYGIRRIVERTRGAGATERSRAVPEVKSMIQEIKDPVLHREALRLATEALGVSPAVLEAAKPATEPISPQRTRRSDPHTEAGSAVLALVLARPELATDALQQGIRAPALAEPFSLSAEDFREESQARIFALLREHAGSDLGAVLSDERVRPLMDQIGALAARGERLYPSGASIREAWLRLGILSRERGKRETSDYDRKDALQSEIQTLKEALRAVASRA